MGHSDNDNLVNELQKEWRANVIKQLADLQESDKSRSSQTDLDKLSERVTLLEQFKYKIIGITIAVQVIAAIIGFLIQKG